MPKRPTKKPAKKPAISLPVKKGKAKEPNEPRFVVGRPRLFETPEDLRVAIQAYLDETSIEDMTYTGLALAIGTSLS